MEEGYTVPLARRLGDKRPAECSCQLGCGRPTARYRPRLPDPVPARSLPALHPAGSYLGGHGQQVEKERRGEGKGNGRSRGRTDGRTVIVPLVHDGPSPFPMLRDSLTVDKKRI